MPILDEIKTMQQQGRTEEEISQALQQKGFSRQQISNAFSQSQIKQAVIASPYQDQYQLTEDEAQYPQTPITEADYSQETLQPSMLPQPAEAPAPEQFQAQEFAQQYTQQPYPTQDYSSYDYGQYSPAATPISSDIITEISEQVVSEKLFDIRKQLEKNIDIKNTLTAEITHIDERLQRIEKIIDRLQLSILQKVGEYTSSVSDLKKELLETQKSFKALSPKSHPSTHAQTQISPAKHKKY